MVCFVNLASVDRIIYSIFQRFNLTSPGNSCSCTSQRCRISIVSRSARTLETPLVKLFPLVFLF
jgi:hypothetical protein